MPPHLGANGAVDAIGPHDEMRQILVALRRLDNSVRLFVANGNDLLAGVDSGLVLELAGQNL